MAKLSRKEPSVLIAEERFKHENPYAEFDESPLRFTEETIRTKILSGIDKSKKTRWTDDEIEAAAENFQKELWKNRDRIWKLDARADTDPVQMLRPEDSLSLIGFTYHEKGTLGQFRFSGEPVEVAGIIDRDHMRVSISNQFNTPIKNFTAAHELGHALLHQGSGLHRDRPMDGSTNAIARDPVEREADKFAAFFLMPKKVIRKTFEQIFLTNKLSLDEHTSFALIRNSVVAEAKTRFPDKRSLALHLATCNRFNALSIVPMNERFGVSAGAMAIRLEELDLIAY